MKMRIGAVTITLIQRQNLHYRQIKPHETGLIKAQSDTHKILCKQNQA